MGDPRPNRIQQKVLDELRGRLEDFQCAPDGYEVCGSFMFAGDGPDGPSHGYVEVDGSITWIVGEFSTIET